MKKKLFLFLFFFLFIFFFFFMKASNNVHAQSLGVTATVTKAANYDFTIILKGGDFAPTYGVEIGTGTKIDGSDYVRMSDTRMIFNVNTNNTCTPDPPANPFYAYAYCRSSPWEVALYFTKDLQAGSYLLKIDSTHSFQKLYVPFQATAPPSIVGGYVHYDIINQNCIQDPGEPPAKGISMLIVSFATAFIRTSTNELGYYRFTGLTSGTWAVTSDSIPSGYDLIPRSKSVFVPPNAAVSFCLVPKSIPTPRPTSATPTGPGTVTPTSGPPAPTPFCFQETHGCGAHDAAPPGTEANEGCCAGLSCQDKNAVGDGSCKLALTGPPLQVIITPTPICSKKPVDITAKVCPASASTKFTIIQNSEITKPIEQTVTADAQGTAVVKGFSFDDPKSGANTNAVNIHVICALSEGNGNFDIVKCVIPPSPLPTRAPAVPPHCAEGAYDPDKGTCSAVDSAIGPIPTSIGSFINRLIGFLIGIGAGIAVIIIIYAGYKMMTSQGNPEAIQNAKDLITSAIVGILFLVFSVLILEVIGVDILRIPSWNK